MSFVISHSAPEIWEATLGQLLLRVTRQNFDSWLRNTIGVRFDGTTLVVAAPTDLACDWLASRMRPVIRQALVTVAGAGLQVRFEVAVAVGKAVAETGDAPPLQPALLPAQPAPLNPRFTFASFQPGSYNRFALSAAGDVATNPESPYSPLFICGGSGVGKTHLLNAIAHDAAVAGQRFLLVNADQFLSEFTNAVRTRTGAAFRARYRDIDLLLIDDVHCLVGKKATVNEFYQTVAGLHDQGRRVVVAGDHGAMSQEAATRFQSQLCWGLVAPIEPPTVEDRICFLTAKSACQGAYLPEEVIHYLALRVRSSIRDLEGAVNRVIALARISSEPLTIDFAARALQPVSAIAPGANLPIQPTQLIEAVSRHLSLPSKDIVGARRDRDLTYARHIAMYMLRRDAGLTYTAIARILGKKDHSTVVHACSQLDRQLSLLPPLRADIDAIRAALHTSATAA